MTTTAADPGMESKPDSPAGNTAGRCQYAVKTALSLTLAYLIPMGMGWPQPQTAAITVMLIAAAGLTSDSLQKGVLRVLGTVAGAVVGLTLIALFPQERMTYLLAVSMTLSLLAYLYHAYQGDTTVFMLTAVVTLMVFNGGDAEGAFLYGVDRAFMTAFGVIVYTAVASVLWPVRAVDNTTALAATVARGYSQVFSRLVHSGADTTVDSDQQLAQLLAHEEAFQSHFNTIRGNAEQVDAYRAEWNCVLACYEDLQATLLPALEEKTHHGVELGRFLENYQPVVEQLEAMFRQVDASWRGEPGDQTFEPLEVTFRPGSLQDQPHLTLAAVAARAELLERVQSNLLELLSALDSLQFDRGDFKPGRKPRGRPLFLWRDLEGAKTAVRMFITFWLATAVWIYFNPPAGFTFVALCSILVLMVSYTPVTPKLLYILFSIGFLFALPAYVFLLPQLSHGLELALFMFAYAFAGFFVFQGPISIFFMFGLFALGIQNSMSYHVDVILMLVLSFYLMFTLLIVTIHFPFTSKAERLYTGLCRRFFIDCARLLELACDYRPRPRRLPRADSTELLLKLRTWGAKIDKGYFPANPPEKITRLNQACEILHGQIQVLLMRRDAFSLNRLICDTPLPLADLCRDLARRKSGPGSAFGRVEARLKEVQQHLDALRDTQQPAQYETRELAQYFVYLNLQATILSSLHECREAQQAVDWQELGGKQF